MTWLETSGKDAEQYVPGLRRLLYQAVVQPECVVESFHLTAVQNADPVGQLGHVHCQHLLKQDTAFLALDLGLRAGEARPGRGGCRCDSYY